MHLQNVCYVKLLELEVVHNKKKLLQYDRRERSSKLIYIACYSKDENQVLKKPVKLLPPYSDYSIRLLLCY